ncbi:uncharacterized protein LOC118240654 [Electrophorus electricus]|uniref:uncharacterized protein LOC118240654 n=1 Tax=Electrophorus electricus TaxID=8005 RepID=UPI0015CF9444|nr:uncharacterized protein LOC118240654 [Electrophorus electricus]
MYVGEEAVVKKDNKRSNKCQECWMSDNLRLESKCANMALKVSVAYKGCKATDCGHLQSSEIIMRGTGSTKKNFFPDVKTIPAPQKSPTEAMANPNISPFHFVNSQRGGSSIYFPEISGVPQRKQYKPQVSQNLRKTGTGTTLAALLKATDGKNGGKSTGRLLDEGQRCSKSRFPSLVVEPHTKSSAVSVKADHTPPAPSISRLPALHPKLAALKQKSPKPAVTLHVPHKHVREVPGKVQDKHSEVNSTFYTRPEVGEVLYQDLERLTSARQCASKVEASQHQHDLSCHKPLLIRRATLHKVESGAGRAAPPAPSLVPRRNRVPRPCKNEQKTKRQDKEKELWA